MKYKAILKYARVSPKKARLISKTLYKLKADSASDLLKFSSNKSSKLIYKLLRSAISNAAAKNEEAEKLIISEIKVDKGPFIKRRKIRSKGRADLIKRKTSHITLVLESIKEKTKKKKESQIDKIKNGDKNGSKNKSPKLKARKK